MFFLNQGRNTKLPTHQSQPPTLNATLDKHRFTYNVPVNNLLRHNINNAVTQNAIVSATRPDGVTPELQLPKLLLPQPRWQYRMTMLSPTHAIKMGLHSKLQLHKQSMFQNELTT